MLNNIGLHVIGNTTLPLANGNAKPTIVKLVDPSVGYVQSVRAQVGPDCLIVIRWYQANQPLDNPKQNAADWFNKHLAFINSVKGKNVIFVGYCEIADSNAWRFAAMELERGRLLRGVDANCGYFEFSVGAPDIPIWLTYDVVLRNMRPGDYICLHEYWSDNVDINNRWHCGRWTLVPQLAGKPIAITECGRDVVEGKGQPGWQKTTDASGFKADLRKYSTLLAQYPNVRGATVFQDGSSDPQWQPFGVASIWRDIVTEYTISAPVTQPITPPATFAFDGRQMNQADFKAHVEGLKLVGSYDKVIIHHTAAPDEALWDKWGGWNYWKNSMRETYIGYKPTWDRGPHCFVDQVGIGLFTPLNQDGIGVTDNNHRTRHIEIVGNFTSHLPDGKRLDNAVWCAAVMLKAAGLGIDRLTYHKAVKDEKECPGEALIANWAWFRGLVKTQLDNNLLSQSEIEAALGVEMQKHIIPLNPAAALEKAGSLMGLLPAGGEFAIEIAGLVYVCQAYRLATNRQWQYGLYCITGDWGNVESFRRAN